jgi:TRAP-type C4-dicarboxylate transport system substrate-binding protein
MDAFEQQGFKLFIDRVNERAKGELFIDLLGGPEVISELDLIRSTSAGVVDIAYNSAGYYPGDVPGVELLMVTNLTATEQRQNGLYDVLNELHKKSNLFYLGQGWESIDIMNVFTKKPVKTPWELKGLKMGDGLMALPFLKEMGAAPVLVKLEDMYSALEKGVIDGVIWPRILVAALGIQEIAKYQVGTGFFRHDLTITVNLDKWNSLPKHLQDLMVEVCISVEQDSAPMAKEAEAWADEEFKAAGMQVSTLSPEDARWMYDKILQTEWDKAIERYPVFGPEIVKLLK